MTDQLITEEAFVDVWGAYVSESGDLLSHEEVKDSPLNTVWTIVEDDMSNWLAIPGFHIVNRLGYCRTNKRWVTGEEAAIWFEAFE